MLRSWRSESLTSLFNSDTAERDSEYGAVALIGKGLCCLLVLSPPFLPHHLHSSLQLFFFFPFPQHCLWWADDGAISSERLLKDI